MATCTSGTRAKAGAASTIWFTWTAFLAWLNINFHRLGTVVWLFQPDSPIDVASFCAAEPEVDPFPSALDWATAVAFGSGPALRTVASYLRSVYDAALWPTVCECVPDPLIPPGVNYDATILADSPLAFWEFLASGQPQPNAVAGSPALTSGGPGSWQTASSPCSTGFWSVNPTSGFDWGSVTIPGLSRNGPFSCEILMRNDGAAVPIFSIGDTGGGLNNVGLYYNNPNTGGHWSIWQGGVTWGDTGQASGQLTSDTWHHVVWTYNGSTHSVWVDGVKLWTSAQGHGAGAATNFSIVNSWINHGYAAKPAVYGAVLTDAQIATHYAAICLGGPIYTPPAPGDPPLPDYPVTTCTTTADLCAAVQQIERKLDQALMLVAHLQTTVSPDGYAPGTAVTGASGSSTLAVSDVIGVRVTASIPTRWGWTYGTPPRSIPKYGSVHFGDASGVEDEHQLHYADQLIFTEKQYATTVTLSLAPDVTATLTPLQRLK